MNASKYVYSIIGFNATKVINLLLDSFGQAKSSKAQPKTLRYRWYRSPGLYHYLHVF